MRTPILSAAIIISVLVIFNYACQKPYNPDLGLRPPPPDTASADTTVPADTTVVDTTDTIDNPDNLPIAQFLLGKWGVTSINIYEKGGPGVFTYKGTPSDYIDLRNDGKNYSFVNNTLDTSSFVILPDDSTIITHQIKNGIADPLPDTSYIRRLTTKLLVLVGRTRAGEFGVDSLYR